MDNNSARETADWILGNPGLIGIDPQTRVELTEQITRELIAAWHNGHGAGVAETNAIWTK